MAKNLKWLLIIVGTLVWSVTMFKSGLQYSYGLGFWGANGHDGIWHLSIINSLSQGTLQMPIFAGEIIKNYHIGFDLLLGLLHRLTGISASNLYFQISPPIFAFLIGFLTYKFALSWFNSDRAAWWSTFFVYFGTSFGWLINKGDSVFWSQQSLSTLINPPFALSLIFLLLGLYFLKQKNYIWVVVIFALLPHIKIYAGLLGFIGLTFACIKDRKLIAPLCLSVLISSPFFFILNPNSASLIEFKPFWFLITLFGPDRLDLPSFFSALNTYLSGSVYFKLIPALLVASVVFVVGNSGLRLVGLGLFFTRKIDSIKIFCLAVLVAGLVLPMLFIQKGTAWNTIQFFYYSLFILALSAGSQIDLIIKKSQVPSAKIILPIVLLLATLPQTTQTLRHYLPSRPPAQLPVAEQQALDQLSHLPKGVVLTYPFDRDAAGAAAANPPRPLYLYESTAYVSAYSGHTVYLEDEVNANITGFNWQERRSQSLKFFSLPQIDFLRSNNIKYIYLVGEQRKSLQQSPSFLKQIYSNELGSIFEVQP